MFGPRVRAPDPVKPLKVCEVPGAKGVAGVENDAVKIGLEKMKPVRGFTLNADVSVPVMVLVVVAPAPLVKVIVPRMLPVMAIEIELRLPKAVLNCGQTTFTFNSVGTLVAPVQVTTRVAAGASPPNSATSGNSLSMCSDSS